MVAQNPKSILDGWMNDGCMMVDGWMDEGIGRRTGGMLCVYRFLALNKFS